MCLIATFMSSTIIRVHVCSCDICLHYLPFQLSPCGKHILLGGNCLLPTFHFHPDDLVCSYLSRMARGDHQNDDDDFMDPPQQNRATGRRKEGDEVTVHTPLLLLHMLLVATSSFAVVCHELKFHDSENMATNDHLSVFCRRRNVLATGPPRND